MASPVQTLAGRRPSSRSIAERPRALTEWFTAQGELVVKPLTATRITTGRINISWAISDGIGQQWVLRERRAGTIRDFSREATTLRATRRLGLPVPRFVGHRDVTGERPFIVTARACGVTLHVEEDADGLTPEQRRTIAFNVVTTMAQLHRVDPATVGLPRFRSGYVDRQLASMTDVWTRSGSYGVHDSAWRAVRARLIECRPRREGRTTLVHGDFRLSNLVLHRDAVSAIIDWDCCTAGPPLADLAWLLVDWRGPAEPAACPPSPTRAGEFPTRDELISDYCEATNFPLHDLAYYRAMAHWRGAALLQAELDRQHAHGLDKHTRALDVGVVDDAIADHLMEAADFLRRPK